MSERGSNGLLAGQVALVTGGARRLGRHLAFALAGAGADVVVHYNTSKSDAEAVAAGIRGMGRHAWCVSADFLQEDSIDGMMATIRRETGRLSIVVNNVGNYLVKPIETTVEREWRDLLEANLIAPITIIRRAIELFPATGGAVINLGYAGVNHLAASMRAPAYQATKLALCLATKAFAKSLAPRNIRVNMISPGQLENSVDLPPDPAHVIPLRRPGTLDDIAKAALFLLDPSSYVTGVNLDVAGGYRMGIGD